MNVPIAHDKRYQKKYGSTGRIVFITDDDGNVIGGYSEPVFPEVLEDMPEVRLCMVRFPSGYVEYVPRELMGDLLPADSANGRIAP